jgi:N-acetylmuramoyl-L-alanine amidase
MALLNFTFTKPKRPVARVFLHCSASDNPAHDNIATMTAWHKARGWSTVGYHFFITKAGVIVRGRSLEVTPAAQANHNAGTIAICLHGLSKAKFTAAQFAALSRLCLQINAAYAGRVTFHGHREVAAKSCPVFDYKAVLKLDRFGKLGLKADVAAAALPANNNSKPTWTFKKAA